MSAPGPPTSPAAVAKAVATDTAALVRAELELAKAELTAGAQRKATGAGLLAAAAALGGLAGLAVLVAAGFALAELGGLPGWASALIIAAALLVVAVVLAAVGRRKLGASVSPEVTKQQISEDVTWVKQRVRERR